MRQYTLMMISRPVVIKLKCVYRSDQFNRLFQACADVIGKHINITMDARMFVLNISQLVLWYTHV